MGTRGKHWGGIAVAAQAAALAVAMGIAAPASAQTDTGIVTNPASGTLGIPVTATIQAACQFNGTGPTATINVPDLNAGAAAQDVPFSVSCNSAFRVGVVSANGALQVTGAGTLPTGYTATSPYQVALHLAGDSSNTADAPLCDASGLAAASGTPCTFRGPSSTTQGLRLSGPSSSTSNASYVRIVAPPHTGSNVLIASNAYVDTLTVTISTAP